MAGHATEDEVGAGQEVVREAAGDVAGLIEPGQRVRRQVDVQASEVVGELLDGPRAEDRDDAALGAEPGECDNGGAESQPAGDVGDGPGDSEATGVHVGEPALGGWSVWVGVLAG